MTDSSSPHGKVEPQEAGAIRNPVLGTLGGQITHLFLEGGLGRSVIRFEVPTAFTNTLGVLQGGIGSAFLDAAMAYAFIAQVGLEIGFTSVSLSTNFLRAVPEGTITAHGRVVSAGKTFVFLEADLVNSRGAVCMKATSTAMLLEPNQ